MLTITVETNQFRLVNLSTKAKQGWVFSASVHAAVSHDAYKVT